MAVTVTLGSQLSLNSGIYLRLITETRVYCGGRTHPMFSFRTERDTFTNCNISVTSRGRGGPGVSGWRVSTGKKGLQRKPTITRRVFAAAHRQRSGQGGKWCLIWSESAGVDRWGNPPETGAGDGEVCEHLRQRRSKPVDAWLKSEFIPGLNLRRARLSRSGSVRSNAETLGLRFVKVSHAVINYPVKPDLIQKDASHNKAPHFPIASSSPPPCITGVLGGFRRRNSSNKNQQKVT